MASNNYIDAHRATGVSTPELKTWHPSGIRITAVLHMIHMQYNTPIPFTLDSTDYCGPATNSIATVVKLLYKKNRTVSSRLPICPHFCGFLVSLRAYLVAIANVDNVSLVTNAAIHEYA